ncbi:MAG: LysM peptidoglycan-binding domain-containing protein [Myxococcales bacterium]|nr:LysM peptidoglycan-binding domain-containing protein [Myxococcales bacterium]MCB9671720.1 LysM peptidoglycan-binding domain-containing protein [Alphaproteobacteria bacterium]
MIGLLLVLLGACIQTPTDDSAHEAIQFRQPKLYPLEDGDTRASVARKWGVTEEELEAWNPGFEELEPGTVVLLHVPAGTEPLAPEPVSSAGKKASPRPRSNSRTRCKTITGAGDMVAAKGLSQSQIKGALRRRMSRMNRCLPSGLHGEYEMIVEVTVACDGRVTNTYTISAGALSATTARCVENVFRYTRFPAHDMPDGMSFQYPLTFSR